MNRKLCGLIAAVACSLLIIANSAPAQGTAFTYQGRLQNNGSPASGIYNLTFALYGVSSGGSSVAGPVTNNTVSITNGLFTVMVDFGSTVWNGQTNWLQVGVETNGASPFTALLPRQQLTPTPYAIYSETASNLTGPVSLGQLPGAVVTNNESSVTLSNATITGNLILANTDSIFIGGLSQTLLYADGMDNVFAGYLAGNVTTESLGGEGNEAVGFGALHANTTGYANVANGYEALVHNTAGSANTANGGGTLLQNTVGNANTAIGADALASNTTGNNNTAVGSLALANNTSGSNNLAEGVGALGFTSNDNELVAVGYQALRNDNAFGTDQTGSGNGENTAIGYQALTSDTSGAGNTAVGYQCLSSNTIGVLNTAVGDVAMSGNLYGSANTAVGNYTMPLNNGSDNTAIGADALQYCTNGSGNTALGDGAGYLHVSGDNNIYIGNEGGSTENFSSENSTIRIGAQGFHTSTFIAGIYGGTLSGGATAPVVIDSSGHLAAATGTSFSPTIGDGTHNFTMSNRTGYYTQIGNLVYFEIWLQWTGKGSAVAGNNVQISLPLTLTSTRVAFPLGFVSGVSFGSQLTAGSNTGISFLLLYSLSNSGGAPANVLVSNCSSSGEIQISGSYRWQ